MVRENAAQEGSEISVGNLDNLGGNWGHLRKSEKEGVSGGAMSMSMSMSMASTVPSKYTNKTNKTMTDEERMAKIQQLLSRPDTGVIQFYPVMSYPVMS